jgi:curli biogenesis system outer membrane secretion channel CsgG
MKNITVTKFFVAAIGCFMLLMTPQYGIAQDKITLESVKEICKDVPIDKRIPMTVARFAVKTKSAQNVFGSELAEMLTNALTNVGCFQMLEMIDNIDDLVRENNLKDNGIMDDDATTDSRFKGAKLVVTGDVTEFEEGSSSGGALGINVSSGSKARVGFIIKVINTQTRQILFSESVDMETKKAGIGNISVIGINLAGGSKRGKLLHDCMERAIIVACDKLAKNREKFNILPAPATGERTTQIKISNTTFAKITALKNGVKALTSGAVAVSDVQTKLNGTEGVLTVRHKGTTDELVELLSSSMSNQLEVTGMDKNIINVAMK